MSRLNLKTNSVRSAFKTLQKRLSVVTRKVNTEAAAQMKAGRYDSTKALMEIGRSFSQFNSRVDEVGKDWDRLIAEIGSQLTELGLTTAAAQSKVTLPRALCLPALRIALQRGGSAEMDDVIAELGRATPGLLKKGDLVEKNGSVRWHTALDKAYRRSQRKGWVEKRADGAWHITSKGRAAVNDADAESVE